MHILLLTPPMTQINTPYPATAYLFGFLKGRGHSVSQADPAIELVLRLFSEEGLVAISKELQKKESASASIKHFQKNLGAYFSTIEATIRFLQGKNPTLAHRIVLRKFLPEGPRFQVLRDLERAEANALDLTFGSLGLQDRAQFLASLYFDDIADVIRDGIDSDFELSKYAEKLAASEPSFDPILEKLSSPPSLVDRYLDEITIRQIAKHRPQVVGITVPFPGNVYGAFRIAKKIKEINPSIQIILGGGYVNTELRSLQESRVFDFVDFITLDDGEMPFLCVLDALTKKQISPVLLRTFVRQDDKVTFFTTKEKHDIPFRDCGTPSYEGLPLGDYLSLCEMLNPMHRLWSDGRWNKLTLAHGCYWKKCTFCDISLDYIGRYEDAPIETILHRMQEMIAETGTTGFHFVDEAAPPKLLKALAEKIIEKKLQVTWWANIRFEKTFTRELTDLLACSGCVAISGGLEVASDRLLLLMEKGVSVEQVARVTANFTESGIMVHAYLMFGFPSQTVQETIDALERVRQLFEMGCIQSAFWHRFSVTAHSPIGLKPEKYGIKLLEKKSTFARNDLDFVDSVGVDHTQLHPGLKKALYNYMHGIGLDEDVRSWFEFTVPRAKVSRHLIRNAVLNS